MTGAGHLVVTGRLDDMLVLHGRNVFPASAGGWVHITRTACTTANHAPLSPSLL